jgi:hypothetical protein
MSDTGMINRGSILGNKYGKLTVVRKLDGGKNTTWVCICDCGNEKVVNRSNLSNGHVTNCGCEIYKKPIKHGMCNSVEYHTWGSIISRCTNPKNKAFKNYGGRGIKVCDRWLQSFEHFYSDMGHRPSEDHSIDRFPNNDGNYEPANCRWATKQEQAVGRNTTVWIDYNGQRMYQKELANYFGIMDSTFCAVIKRRGVESAIKYYENKNNKKVNGKHTQSGNH